MTPFYRTSRFWMAVVTALLVVANEGLGLAIPETVVLPFAALIIAYVLGESAVVAANTIAEARVQVARENHIASMEYARITGQVKSGIDLEAASAKYAAIENEANKKL